MCGGSMGFAPSSNARWGQNGKMGYQQDGYMVSMSTTPFGPRPHVLEMSLAYSYAKLVMERV